MKKNSSNFNKLFATTAIATAAVVVPTAVVGAEGTGELTISGINAIGSELTADITALPEGAASYLWQRENDNGSYDEISTDSKYMIQATDAGKKIVLKVTIGSNVYESSIVVIDTILPIKGANIVNGTLYAEIGSLADKPVVKSYQWYYLENGKKTPIAGAKNIKFSIPPEAAGKKIIVEAVSEGGVNYTSAVINVNPLKLSVTKPTFEGFTENQNIVVPGDVLKVKEVIVTDVYPVTTGDNATIKPEQISFTYQWMNKVGDAYSYIEGATSSSYTVPADALDKQVNQIAVRVTAKVGTTESDPVNSAIVFLVSTELADELVEKIKALHTVKEGKLIYTDDAADVIENLQQDYNNLTTAAKANVKNYSILERAIADKKIIDELTEKVKEIPELKPDSDIPDVERADYISKLKAEYEKLDYLQRSMDKGDMIYNALYNSKTEITHEINKVLKIDTKISELLVDHKDPFEGYNSDLEGGKYNSILEKLQDKVKEIDGLIAKLSPEYKSVVQYQNVLTTAKSDIKKVQAFIKKFDKLDLKAEPKKQISTAKSIRTAYNKLTIKQMSLAPADLIKDLEAAEKSEHTEVEELQGKIEGLIELQGNVEYIGKPTSQEDWSEYVKKVNSVISEYKSLTKQAASKVTGYQQLLTLQKDLKAAEKVVKQIEAYNALSLDTKYTKKISAYKSMKQAYNKLTTLQQSLVYNYDEDLFGSPPEDQTTEGNIPEEKAEADVVITKIIAVLEESTSTEINEYALKIDSVITEYKQLSSKARKYVTNYNTLITMQKDVKSVLSFIKKVDAADAETNASKKYTKIQSVKKAYAKLPAKQQELAAERYLNLIEQLDNTGMFENLETFNEKLSLLVDEDLYVQTIAVIKEYENSYKNLSSAEKKQITNYPILKQAISDVKKVESFLKKYQTEKTQASALKSFASLTAKQTSLLEPGIRTEITNKLGEQQSANEAALELIGEINGLLQSGVYIEGLKGKVEGLRIKYDDLSASEKNLVKNYSKLTQAEKDLQKVAEVDALQGDLDTWQKEYNRLSRKLENLYNQLYTFPTSTP